MITFLRTRLCREVTLFFFKSPGLRFEVQVVAETEAGLVIGEQRAEA